MTTMTHAPSSAGLRIHCDESTTPGLVMVLVVPSHELPDCDIAVNSALARGAVVYAREIQVAEGGASHGDVMFSEAIEHIAATVDRACADHPGLPVVLVGHASAEGAATMYAELYPEDLAGLVLTRACDDCTA